MEFRDLVLKTRSYRRFDGSHRFTTDDLAALVDAARLTPSGANLQPLKYIVSTSAQTNASLFKTLAWAGYLTGWPGPAENERPSGYVVILLDTTIKTSAGADLGIAAQTILLAATEKGWGGCMIGAFKKDDLASALGLPDSLEPLLVIALGRPVEEVVLEGIGAAGIKYYRDDRQVHHVPKRSLEDVLVKRFG